MPMQYKTLGNSDLKVSVVCLGTMTWGNQNTEEEAFEQLDYAWSQGVNFLDTAELYPVPPNPEQCGRTEEYIGNWMEKRGNRKDVIIATKVCGVMPKNFIRANRTVPKNEDAPLPNLDAENMNEAIEGSLRRMKTDYVDLYQLHWPSRYAPIFGASKYEPANERERVEIEDSVKAIGELIKAGKVKEWGLSNETTLGVIHFAEAAKKLGVKAPISIQNDFSLVDRMFETELAEACAPSNYNIGLLPYGPLAGGALTGKYLDGGKPAKARGTLFKKFQPRYFCEPTMVATAKYAALAKSKGISPTTLALAWCASRWYVTSTIIGATTMDQLKECIAAFEVTLDQETLDAIDVIHYHHKSPTIDVPQAVIDATENAE